MGITTVVLVSNDQLGDIGNNPAFGEDLARAVGVFRTSLRDDIRVPTGAKIIGQEHNNAVCLYLVNGGLAKLVSVYDDKDARINTEEEQIAALQRLASNLGLKLIKKPKVRHRTILDKNAMSLARRKTFRCKGSSTIWKVVKGKRNGSDYHMLCRNGSDYAVFSFSLRVNLRKHVPSDKFTHGAKNGKALFDEISSRSV